MRGPRGPAVEPAQPNAVKLETFVFDALPLAGQTVVLETRRRRSSAPSRTPTARTAWPPACTTRSAAPRWLEKAGVAVPRDADGQVACALEISPLHALDAQDLARKAPADMKLHPGQEVYLG